MTCPQGFSLTIGQNGSVLEARAQGPLDGNAAPILRNLADRLSRFTGSEAQLDISGVDGVFENALPLLVRVADAAASGAIPLEIKVADKSVQDLLVRYGLGSTVSGP